MKDKQQRTPRTKGKCEVTEKEKNFYYCMGLIVGALVATLLHDPVVVPLAEAFSRLFK